MRKIIYQLHKVLGKNFLQVVINCFHFSTRIQKNLWKTLQDAKTVMIFFNKMAKMFEKISCKAQLFSYFFKSICKNLFSFL